jgi:Domain of unknown function (DUF6378)
MNRQEILKQIEEAVCKDRQTTHGKPEQSFQHIAAFWDLYLTTKAKVVGEPVSVEATDVASMMALMKIVRSIKSREHLDNWSDAAGYMICGGEIATEGNRVADSFEDWSHHNGEIGHATAAEVASLQPL